jgi:hypothetical protein
MVSYLKLIFQGNHVLIFVKPYTKYGMFPNYTSINLLTAFIVRMTAKYLRMFTAEAIKIITNMQSVLGVAPCRKDKNISMFQS